MHLLTEELGRVVVLVRGAWREKNSYEGALDLLVRGRVVISLVQGRELGLLVQRRIATNYPALRRDLGRFAGACHLLQQVLHFEQVGEQDRLEPEVTASKLVENDGVPSTTGKGRGEAFRLVERALTALETIAVTRVPLLLLAFDLRFARLHGLAPEVAQCVRCGGGRALARFVPAEGGVVCTHCLERPDEGLPIDRATAALMREVASQPLHRAADPPPAALSRARRLVDAHLAYHADTPLAVTRSPLQRGTPRHRGHRPLRGDAGPVDARSRGGPPRPRNPLRG